MDRLLRKVQTLEAVVDEARSGIQAEIERLYKQIGVLSTQFFSGGGGFPRGERFRVELPLKIKLRNPRVFDQGVFVPIDRFQEALARPLKATL